MRTEKSLEETVISYEREGDNRLGGGKNNVNLCRVNLVFTEHIGCLLLNLCSV